MSFIPIFGNFNFIPSFLGFKDTRSKYCLVFIIQIILFRCVLLLSPYTSFEKL
jgi:hypothetical protein